MAKEFDDDVIVTPMRSQLSQGNKTSGEPKIQLQFNGSELANLFKVYVNGTTIRCYNENDSGYSASSLSDLYKPEIKNTTIMLDRGEHSEEIIASFIQKMGLKANYEEIKMDAATTYLKTDQIYQQTGLLSADYMDSLNKVRSTFDNDYKLGPNIETFELQKTDPKQKSSHEMIIDPDVIKQMMKFKNNTPEPVKENENEFNSRIEQATKARQPELDKMKNILESAKQTPNNNQNSQLSQNSIPYKPIDHDEQILEQLRSLRKQTRENDPQHIVKTKNNLAKFDAIPKHDAETTQALNTLSSQLGLMTKTKITLNKSNQAVFHPKGSQTI